MKTLAKKAKKGFTIVELVIVIAVIAILAAVLIPTFTNVVANARESAAMQESRNEWINYLSEIVTDSDYSTDDTYYVAYNITQDGSDYKAGYIFVVEGGQFTTSPVVVNGESTDSYTYTITYSNGYALEANSANYSEVAESVYKEENAKVVIFVAAD